MAKLAPITPEEAASAEWRSVYKLETTTPAYGGTTAFDGNDDPTAGHMNAQAIQMMQNMEILRHRNPGPSRNAILSAVLNGSTGNADHLTISSGTVNILAATEPLVLSFAAGFGRQGAVDYVGYVDVDGSVDGSALASGTFPLYAVYDTADGSVAYTFGCATPTGFSVQGFETAYTAPAFSGSGDVAGRYWWNPHTGKVHRSEGMPGSLAWVHVCAVCLGIIQSNGAGTLTIAQTSNIGPTVEDETQIPAGTVTAYAGTVAPAGWLLCNGAAVSRVTYRRLFTRLSTVFGAGDGSTTFNLPDLRGEFIRGYDDGRGVDTGRGFGTAQADMLEAHTHTLSYHNGGGASAGAFLASDATTNASFSTDSTGGAETRPRNVAMNFIIKI